MPIKIVAIAGLSGSGKTTVANAIMSHFSHQGRPCVIISVDDYYRPPKPDTNFDLPKAVELELLAAQLNALRRGESIEVPKYCLVTSKRLPQTTPITPLKDMLVIVEGIFALNEAVTSDVEDLFKLYVNTPRDISIVRRLVRDETERARPLRKNAEYYLSAIWPHLHHVESTQTAANYVLPGSEGSDIEKAIQYVEQFLNSFVVPIGNQLNPHVCLNMFSEGPLIELARRVPEGLDFTI